MSKIDLQQLRIDRDAAEPVPGRRRHGWLLGIAALIAASAVAWGVSGSKPAPSSTVSVVTAQRASVPAEGVALQASGYVVARRQATVSAQVTGTLVEVLIEEGEYVEQGQLLARLADTSQRAALNLEIAQLASARSVVDQFAVQLAQQRRDLQRFEALSERDLVAQQTVDDARSRMEAAAAELESLRRQVEVMEARKASAEVQLGYTAVRAPFSGVVVTKAAQVGEIVSPLSAGGGFTRTGICTIVDMESLELEVSISESYINRIKAGQRATARFDAYPDLTLPAHVIAIIPTADRSSATVDVRVAVDDQDSRMLPDMGAQVVFLADDAPATDSRLRQSGVLIPASSLLARDQRLVVFAVEGDQLREVTVTELSKRGDMLEVAGLEHGARIVRQAQESMNTGTRIAVSESAEELI